MIGDKIKKNQKGFSLLEMIVAVGIFVLLILMVLNIFQTMVVLQKDSVATQSVQETLRYALEMMSKEIRSAVISDDECGAGLINKVFNGDGSDPSEVLYFKNSKGECVSYSLSGGRVMIDKDTFSGALPITPANITITDLIFGIVDTPFSSGSFTEQPRVTVYFNAEYIISDKYSLPIQTTISARVYE